LSRWSKLNDKTVYVPMRYQNRVVRCILLSSSSSPEQTNAISIRISDLKLSKFKKGTIIIIKKVLLWKQNQQTSVVQLRLKTHPHNLLNKKRKKTTTKNDLSFWQFEFFTKKSFEEWKTKELLSQRSAVGCWETKDISINASSVGLHRVRLARNGAFELKLFRFGEEKRTKQ
jgi:hypothetical protein